MKVALLSKLEAERILCKKLNQLELKPNKDSSDFIKIESCDYALHKVRTEIGELIELYKFF